ncbi:MAG TPA: hypothetical protein VF960_12675, partial [Chloroflexota bacterium]
SKNVFDTLGNVYAFGAATSYMLVFISLLTLRIKDPWTPRPFKVPLNVRVPSRNGQAALPIVGILGFLGISTIIVMVVATHDIGRIAGPGWIILGLAIFWIYRKWAGLPLLHSTHHDWEKEQLQVYQNAGEIEMLEEYQENLQRRDRLAASHQRNGVR